jgi:hypothetical protein
MSRLVVITVDSFHDHRPDLITRYEYHVDDCLKCPMRSSIDYQLDKDTGKYFTECIAAETPRRLWADSIGTIPVWCPLPEVDPAVPPSPASP